MTGCLLLLCVLGVAVAVPVARALNRAVWPERGPVLGLWVWQCLVATALLSCLTALVLGLAAGFRTVRDHLFGSAPPGVVAAYRLSSAPAWAMALTLLLAAGAAWTVAVLVGQLGAVRRARGAARARLRERAPELPAGLPAGRGPLLVLEEEHPDVWWVPGSPFRLVVTTGALHRLTDRQLDAVLTHERGHARARHDWLLQVSAALAGALPRVLLFTHFCEQTHRLVEWAADDTAARHCGHVTTALALIELNQHRGVLSHTSGRRLLDDRVNRLLTPPPTLRRRQRTLIAGAAALAPLLPLLITFAPGIDALH
ncbi:M56 family metallopeptidase [Streptomyces misionensis]|uniref:M56 family metallopeptidase n=1 Tax=Streptomyces misionensis TaxID=67331 RepID=A0A5C6K8N0_9ACTN|nr:M56 family metallopeptidase [Streptomyces misionensis]TWV58038.1 M56 family metallopeptidase [Streptomyces misionensis]